MTRRRFDISGEKGFTLFYMAVFLTLLGLFTGLAVDSGRAYVVKAQLSKAVDGAALGAARMLNSGDPKAEAIKIFKQNFPSGYMGTSAADPTAAGDFFDLKTDAALGVNIITVKASTVMATTFMKLANLNNVTVASSGEATRRMVDLSLVLDVSSSIGSKWPAVRDAIRVFIDNFDKNNDRMSLVFFGNGAKVIDAMNGSRGFDKAKLMADVPNALPGGSTAMVQGLYRGWDELRSVSNGQQSGIRVIVLFTDGASNSVPGLFDATGQAKGLRTWDFPNNGADPDNQTHANPEINGLYHTDSGAGSPALPPKAFPWACYSPVATCTQAGAQYLPATSFHSEHRSSGIPTSFPLQTNTITVEGASQISKRGLRDFNAGLGKYPAHVVNINNAARNLIEIISNEARSDAAGDYKIRIYTIGMGELVQYLLGSRQEKSEDILKRMANDKLSPDFNSAQLEGKYFFAKTEADVGSAFQALQNQIIRLSK